MQRFQLKRAFQGLLLIGLSSALSSCAFLAVLTEAIYVGVDGGITTVNSSSGEDDSGGGGAGLLLGGGQPQATVDETDVGYGVSVGSNFNKWCGVEIGYQDLGTETYVDIDANSNIFDGEVTTDGYYLAAIGRYPFSEFSSAAWLANIEAIARLGLFMWEQDDDGVTVNLGNQPYSESDDGTDLTYGIGLRAGIWKGLSARVEYDYIDEIKFSNLWFGLSWSF